MQFLSSIFAPRGKFMMRQFRTEIAALLGWLSALKLFRPRSVGRLRYDDFLASAFVLSPGCLRGGRYVPGDALGGVTFFVRVSVAFLVRGIRPICHGRVIAGMA